MDGNEVDGVLDQLSQMKARKAEAKAELIEDVEDYKKAISRMCDTEDGRLFIKYLLRYSGVFTVDTSLNAAKIIEDNGKKSIYLDIIRPYLDIDILVTIENQK